MYKRQPRELVVSGLYRFVRNPMYDGALLVLFGHVLWFPSLSLHVCPIIFFVSFHLFVVLYEERTLRKTFGAAYEQYCRDVPRWLPRVRSPRR